MTHDEMVALIRGGVGETGGVWADFGAGRGNFTRALRDLLGAEATIYAIDHNVRALKQIRCAHTIQADFTQPLDLPLLDGVLMVNSLHFIREQVETLRRIVGYLRPGGRLLIVEYAVSAPRSYIPYPVPFERFQSLAKEAGFSNPVQVGYRRSPSMGISMYAGAACKR